MTTSQQSRRRRSRLHHITALGAGVVLAAGVIGVLTVAPVPAVADAPISTITSVSTGPVLAGPAPEISAARAAGDRAKQIAAERDSAARQPALTCEPWANARLVGNIIVNKDCPDLIAAKEADQHDWACRQGTITEGCGSVNGRKPTEAQQRQRIADGVVQAGAATRRAATSTTYACRTRSPTCAAADPPTDESHPARGRAHRRGPQWPPTAWQGRGDGHADPTGMIRYLVGDRSCRLPTRRRQATPASTVSIGQEHRPCPTPHLRWGAALAATRAAGPTRFTMRLERDGSRARLDGVRPTGPLRGLARFLGRRLLRTVEVEGVLDPEDRRVVASTGDVWGMIQIGDRVWTGRPGRRIDDRSAEPATLKLDPLALIESIDGLHDARDRESPEAGRHFVAPTDTGTVEVSLRNARVHRIRRDDDGDITTLDLHEAGVDTSALDWTRLPGDGLGSDD